MLDTSLGIGPVNQLLSGRAAKKIFNINGNRHIRTHTKRETNNTNKKTTRTTPTPETSFKLLLIKRYLFPYPLSHLTNQFQSVKARKTNKKLGRKTIWDRQTDREREIERERAGCGEGAKNTIKRNIATEKLMSACEYNISNNLPMSRLLKLVQPPMAEGNSPDKSVYAER